MFANIIVCLKINGNQETLNIPVFHRSETEKAFEQLKRLKSYGVIKGVVSIINRHGNLYWIGVY